MHKTSARLLQLLTLLQTRRSWTGAQLAEALEVTTRTVRNDVERLRELGYAVIASPGIEGGYRLRPGRDLPPVLLTDDEAVAAATGLRIAAAGALAGIEESSLRAALKLEQVMPDRVRERVRALQSSVLTLPQTATPIDAELLLLVATACHRSETLRFDYRSHAGTEASRHVEPLRTLHDGRRWYLVGWDLDREDWRTFRVDRMRPRLPLGPRFAPRTPPPDLVAKTQKSIQRATWRFKARVRIHAPAAELGRRLPRAVTLKPIDDASCVAHVGSDSAATLAGYLALLGADFEVLDAPELRREVEVLGRRLLRASRAKGARS